MTATASDAPQRAAGLRTRSGNAMLRTRAAILDAAAGCVERCGVRRTTMSDIASTGGVAKATLYNHFRTKDDVLAALLDARVTAVAGECEALAGTDLAAGLEHAAAHLATSPSLRRVAAEEPALLAPLAVPGSGRGWEQARAAVAQVLRAGGATPGPVEVDLVLRWLLSQLLWPVPPGSAREAAVLLAVAVGGSPQNASPVAAQGTLVERAHPVGLGWPAGPDRLRTT